MSNRVSGTIKLRLARRRVTRPWKRIRRRWPTTSRWSKPANSERENRALNRDTTVNGGVGAAGAAAGETATATAMLRLAETATRRTALAIASPMRRRRTLRRPEA